MVADGIFVTGLLSTYCEVEDVLCVLTGYDLSSLGDSESLAGRIRDLLAGTQAAFDREAGRDFIDHAGAELELDGTGTEWLLVGARGIRPIRQVLEVEVDGRQVLPEQYVCYPDEGAIRLRPDGAVSSFARGERNVRVLLDWGYEAPPPEIKLAQAKMVAAQILAEASSTSGSATSVRIGDYAVSYSGDGAHASTIARWLGDAQRAAALYRTVRMATV